MMASSLPNVRKESPNILKEPNFNFLNLLAVKVDEEILKKLVIFLQKMNEMNLRLRVESRSSIAPKK